MAAALLPLLMGAPAAISGLVDLVGSFKKLKRGHGGASRRLRRRRYSTRRRGSALSVMSKYPLLQRPYVYSHGGGMIGPADIKRMINPALLAVKGAARRAAPYIIPPALAQIAHMKMQGRGGRASPRAHYVRAHTAMTRNGPVHVKGHYAAGGASAYKMLIGAAPRRRTARGGKFNPLGMLKGLVHALPVVGPMSQMMGFGGYSGMGGAQKVRAHYRITPSGGVTRVRSHVKTRGGLLNPAGGIGALPWY